MSFKNRGEIEMYFTHRKAKGMAYQQVHTTENVKGQHSGKGKGSQIKIWVCTMKRTWNRKFMGKSVRFFSCLNSFK